MYYGIEFKKIFGKENLKNIFKEHSINHIFIFAFSLLLLLYTGKTNYKLFHSIIETLTAVACLSLFIIVINTYKISKNSFFIYLGIVYGFVSIFNLLHGIADTGIFNISTDPINLSVQLNISYRIIEGISILISFIFLYKPIKPILVFYSYTLISSLLLYIIFFTKLFPACFIYNFGLTSFEIKCEHAILLIMLSSILLFIKNRKHFSKTVICYMSLYLVFTILVRTISITNTTIYNDFCLVSHILKFISYYFLYKALVENVLNHPLNILYNDLSHKNSELNLKTIELKKTVSKLNEENIKLEKIKKELQLNKDKQEKLLEFLPDAIFVTHNSKFIYVNTAAVDLFKAENKEELLGKTPLNFVHKDYLDVLTERLEAEKNHINPYYNFNEYKLVTIDGEIIDVELKTSPIGCKGDNLCITVLYDIGERKKAEHTAKLLYEAQENEKLKTEFFSNLSHELRTPINVIYSALQVMDLNNNPKFIEKYHSIIKQNCYRLLRIINNIIDSTKIDAGYLKLNLTYDNIIPVVEDISLSISSYVESKGMDLIFDTDVEELYLDFDPDIIERIILNLLSNAVKFTEKGGTINVFISHNDESVIIGVKDTGIGISKDQQSIIFERFRQVDKSLSRNKEGSGIGLSLVKSLVELHKGTITLTSTEGVGSEFIIQLPILETLKYSAKSKQTIDNNVVQKINIEFSDIYS
jgi:PAS domain S-box-containing protein